MNGVLGALLWLAVYAALFSLALRSLGLVKSRRDEVALWAVLAAGASIGAAAPWLVSGRATLSGVGLPVGLVTSLAVFLTARVMLPGDRPSLDRSDWRIQGTALALMATIVAHVVEIHVGIAITSTRLYFWVLAAVLLIVAAGWLDSEEPPSIQGGRRRHASDNPHSRFVDLVTALLAFGVCLPWIHALTLGGRQARTVGAILGRSWGIGGLGPGGDGHPAVLFWLVASTLALSAVIGRRIDEKGLARDRSGLVAAGMVVAAIGVCAVLQATRVARSIPAGGGETHITVAAETAAGQYGELTWVVLVLAVVVGAAIGTSGGGERRWCRRSPVATLVAGLLLGIVAMTVIQRSSIDPIRADGLLKAANALASNGQQRRPWGCWIAPVSLLRTSRCCSCCGGGPRCRPPPSQAVTWNDPLCSIVPGPVSNGPVSWPLWIRTTGPTWGVIAPPEQGKSPSPVARRRTPGAGR